MAHPNKLRRDHAVFDKHRTQIGSFCRARLTKLVAPHCLAPDIVTAIVEGRQPPTLKASMLQDIDLPIAWIDQRALLGFA